MSKTMLKIYILFVWIGMFVSIPKMSCSIGESKKILEALRSVNSLQLLWPHLLLLWRLLVKERRDPVRPVMLLMINQRNWFLVLAFGLKKWQRNQGPEREGFCWNAEVRGAQISFIQSGIEKCMRDIVMYLKRYLLKILKFSSCNHNFHRCPVCTWIL